jgi:hypothetical protein
VQGQPNPDSCTESWAAFELQAIFRAIIELNSFMDIADTNAAEAILAVIDHRAEQGGCFFRTHTNAIIADFDQQPAIDGMGYDADVAFLTFVLDAMIDRIFNQRLENQFQDWSRFSSASI